MIIDKPLVSVGIPAYNRPDSLRKVLDSILDQSHENIEIIISDDCSPDEKVAAVGKEYEKLDKRVKFYRQEKNIGMPANFQFVLEKASADFFMWAADDDKFVPEFIEKCLEQMLNDENIVAVGMEICYCTNNNNYDFFKLGVPFYDRVSDNPYDRVVHMINNYHGDMIYSLYRKEALYKNDAPCTSLMPVTPIESPLFIFVSWLGHWVILPEIGLHKAIDDKRYHRIKWFIQGGVLPGTGGVRKWRFSHLKRIPIYLKLNFIELNGMLKAIDNISAPMARRLKIKTVASFSILKFLIYHFCQFKFARF